MRGYRFPCAPDALGDWLRPYWGRSEGEGWTIVAVDAKDVPEADATLPVSPSAACPVDDLSDAIVKLTPEE